MARPVKPIDADMVRRAAEAGLTRDEIARVLGVSSKTIQRRFGKQVAEGNERGVSSIKLKLHQKAMGGNIAALIFSLKNRAGWSDRNTISGPGGGPIQHEDVSALSDADLQAVIDGELKRSGIAAEIDAAGAGGDGGASAPPAGA